jgi:hypothetical protein
VAQTQEIKSGGGGGARGGGRGVEALVLDRAPTPLSGSSPRCLPPGPAPATTIGAERWGFGPFAVAHAAASARVGGERARAVLPYPVYL